MAQAGPELQVWQETYADRGLIPWGISIQESYEQAQAYWEDENQHTHPWSADPGFATGGFSDDAIIGTPAYLMVDLETMKIRLWQEGYSGAEEALFEPFLRAAE